LVTIDIPGAVPPDVVAGYVAPGVVIGVSDGCLWQLGTVTVVACVVTPTTATTAGAVCVAQTEAGMVKVPVISRELAVEVTVSFSVSPGRHVIKDVTVSVVTWPTGQLVTVGAQDAMV